MITALYRFRPVYILAGSWDPEFETTISVATRYTVNTAIPRYLSIVPVVLNQSEGRISTE